MKQNHKLIIAEVDGLHGYSGVGGGSYHNSFSFYVLIFPKQTVQKKSTCSLYKIGFKKGKYQ